MKKYKSLILLIGLIILTTLNSCKKSNNTPNTNNTNNTVETGVLSIHVSQSCNGTTDNLSNGIIKIYTNETNYNSNNSINTYTINNIGNLKVTLDYQPTDYYIAVTGTLTLGKCYNTVKTTLFKRTIVANNTTNVSLSIGN